MPGKEIYPLKETAYNTIKRQLVPNVDFPVITAIDPSMGTKGDLLEIDGDNFDQQGTIVHFGIKERLAKVLNENLLKVKVPYLGNLPLTINVFLSTGAGFSNLFPFSYTPPTPIISSLIPSIGPAETLVQINGKNFFGSQVSVNLGSRVIPGQIISRKMIEFYVADIGEGGAVLPVSVTTETGTSNSLNYTYSSGPPVISEIVPSKSTVGSKIIIFGKFFVNYQTQVNFGSTSVEANVISFESLSVIVPNLHPGNLDITVSTPLGTSNSLPFVVTPTIVSPNEVRGL